VRKEKTFPTIGEAEKQRKQWEAEDDAKTLD
jgi:hypothetical protein